VTVAVAVAVRAAGVRVADAERAGVTVSVAVAECEAAVREAVADPEGVTEAGAER
jgi:hypothetical protein